MMLHLVGLLLASTAAGATWWWSGRSSRARRLPAFPSHVDALPGPPSPLTRFLAAVHDLTMTVTGAWNAAHARSDGLPIEAIIQRDVLRDARAELMEASKELARVLQPYEELAARALVIGDRARRAWSVRHVDHHREEARQIQVGVDDLGEPRYERTILRIYDGTTHTYTYDAEVGASCLAAVEDWWTPSWPSIETSDRVDPAALDATARSFLERLLGFEEGTEEDLERELNRWTDGRRVLEPLAAMRKNAARLTARVAPTLALHHQIPEQHQVRTRDQGDAGPEAYRAFDELIRTSERICACWGQVDAVIIGTNELATRVLAWAEDPSVIEPDLAYLEAAAEASALVFREPVVVAHQSLPARLGRPAAAGLLMWAAFYLLLAVL